ncbi:MAG: hypothetical protein PHG19_06110 [Anaerotignum sp.]|nr:hypothetical protein [Anaerotignum sp.]
MYQETIHIVFEKTREFFILNEKGMDHFGGCCVWVLSEEYDAGEERILL